MYVDLVKMLNCISAFARMEVTLVAEFDQRNSLDMEVISVLLYSLIVNSGLNVWCRASHATNTSLLISVGYYVLLLNTLCPSSGL